MDKAKMITAGLMLWILLINGCVEDIERPGSPGTTHPQNTETTTQTTTHTTVKSTATVTSTTIETTTSTTIKTTTSTKEETASTQAPICRDTDGGKDYYVQGTAIRIDGVVHTDVCCKNQLKEYFCRGDGEIDFSYYNCRHGCRYGACIKSAD